MQQTDFLVGVLEREALQGEDEGTGRRGEEQGDWRTEEARREGKELAIGCASGRDFGLCVLGGED